MQLSMKYPSRKMMKIRFSSWLRKQYAYPASCPRNDQNRTLNSVVASGLLTTLVAGCGSNSEIAAVGKFSEKTKAEINSIGPALVSDISESCKRSQAWALPTGEKLFQEDPESRKLVFLLDKKARERCDTKEMTAATDSYKAGHKVISRYIAAIGKLAGADIPVFDDEMKSLVPALGGMPFIPDKDTKATVEAGGSIANILFRIIGEGFQRSKLVSSMASADKPLEVVATNYTDSINRYYINGLLETEMLAATAFYGNPLDIVRRTTNSPVLLVINPFLTANLTRSLVVERQEIAKRKAFAETYISLLNEISCDHTKLLFSLQGNSASSADRENAICGRLQQVNSAKLAPNGKQGIATSAYVAKIIPKYYRLISKLRDLSASNRLGRSTDHRP
jgi:hypothetical protein